MNYIVYRILKILLKPFFMINHRVKYIGLDNIPKTGGVILAGNHTGNMDALLMLGGPKRIVHMMAKKELFNSKFKNSFFKSMACISVDRSIHDTNAKNEAIDVLKSGGVIGIFPEGTSNKTDELLLPFKFGAVSMAKKSDSYIVPFSITDSYNPFKGGICLTYGKAYKVVSDLESENKKLEDKVKSLIINSKRRIKWKISDIKFWDPL